MVRSVLISISSQPLSDIFSSQLHAIASPKRTPKPDRPVLSFVIAQDPHEERKVQNAPALPKQYTDSGYHGSQEDEMDVDIPARISSYKPSPPAAPNQDNRPGETTQEAAGSLSAERRTTEGSFHSAREDMTAKVPFAVPETNNSNKDVHGQELHPAESAPSKAGAGDSHEKTGDLGAEPDQKRDLVQELDDIGSPSDGSTPDRPLVRKSSLTFASLPAREPLNTKKSFGTRDSRTSHLDQLRNGRSSHFGKQTAAALPITTESQKNGYIDQMMVDVDEARTVDTEDADLIAAQAHSKSSTQRLHEKIDMLGKSQPSRPSKSIPSATALAASNLKKSEAVMKADKEAVARTVDQSAVDEDDDWIKPLESSEKDIRPPLTKSYTTDVMENIGGNENGDDDDEMEFDIRAPELIAHEERMRTPVRISPSPGKMLPGFGHAKSASTVTLASPGKAALAPGLGHTKTISVSNPPYPSTTPKGSPRRIFDAPLSASKSKLQSIMKTAKGLFTSSAGVSAAAKMETLSPKALHMAANNMPGLYPNITSMLEDKPLPPSPAKEGRKTRSSTEREREEKKKEREIRDRQKAEEQLEKAREKEKQSAAQFKAEERNALAQSSRPLQPIRKSPRKAAEEQQEIEQPPESHDMPPPALPSLQGKAQRPAKPTREPPKKNRPQPMSIRVGSTLSQRMPITTASLASNLQDILPPNNPNPSNAKAPVVSKKTSNASLNSSTSNPGFKSSVTAPAGKPRALLAAERKKEADEREAQRKLEQKREAERKRAAQQEEARRQEQKERAEAEHKARERIAAEQAKKSAQQQAIEKRRQEQTKKMEQQRNAIVANDMVSNCSCLY